MPVELGSFVRQVSVDMGLVKKMSRPDVCAYEKRVRVPLYGNETLTFVLGNESSNGREDLGWSCLIQKLKNVHGERDAGLLAQSIRQGK
ncbi:hypothetical protein Tco_1371014 [Tanacetum coccineum]